MQCETDLGGATFAPEAFTTENPMHSTSSETSPPPTETIVMTLMISFNIHTSDILGNISL